MKEILGIIANDLHLKIENIPSISNLFDQLIELAIEKGTTQVFLLGDILDSRISQRLDVLKGLEENLLKFSEAEIHVTMIAGNHDKNSYTSKDSFLDQFRFFPNVNLIREYEEIDMVVGARLHFMPFFEDKTWMSLWKPQLLEGGSNVLLTHMAFEGSVNNDGSKMSSVLKPSLFKDFDVVLSGHYHNLHKVGENIYHLPAVQQNDFGEDTQKGFTILSYDTATKEVDFELHQSTFKQYKKIVIDVDKTPKKDIDLKVQKYSGSSDNIRFEFIGTESKVKAIDKNIFISKGIDVKTKYKEIEDTLEEAHEEVKQHSIETLNTEFEEFCTVKELEFEKGIKYLN